MGFLCRPGIASIEARHMGSRISTTEREGGGRGVNPHVLVLLV